MRASSSCVAAAALLWGLGAQVQQAAAQPALAPTLSRQPLDKVYPDFVHCDPAETQGCFARCTASVPEQKTARARICMMVRCISSCTAPTSRGCPAAGTRACEQILRVLAKEDVTCAVECSM
uniref:Uncharacterized protein n=1 Tax=Alexandrium catenella TaxID=2925 RepID=A0A7S1WIG9_ALECA|mmetsp:Transcript_63892/g.170633  ORF Transcript_63892/g.170633 Transcript_63892/m.170633 type:complete len:122 (+) Transcript_63892:70-435(+)